MSTEKREELGFDAAPPRYMTQGRETVDRMRDEAFRRAVSLIQSGAVEVKHVEELADALFLFACETHARKYRDRAGHKAGASAEEDRKKALFWEQMAAHVRDEGASPDPRSRRPGFTPYRYHHAL